ncbi:Rieske 2Fe-2S domain-containing protein [Rhizobium beringeri]
MVHGEVDFPLNAWYAAAYDVEVRRVLLARRICNKPIVLYRKEDGTAAALADACWHRLVPLSPGRLEGDKVICGYHGLNSTIRAAVRTCRRSTPSIRRPA